MMIKLVKPTIEDMKFRKEMLSDEATMEYNGSTISFNEDRWETWFNTWVVNSNNRYYYYVYSNELKRFVGEVVYYLADEYDKYIVSVIIKAEYRNKGFGTEALKQIIKLAKDNGVTSVSDDIVLDSPSLSIFHKLGFVEEWHNDEISFVTKKL
jgi:RimJ/RimL family protein N-acetyltransferase